MSYADGKTYVLYFDYKKDAWEVDVWDRSTTLTDVTFCVDDMRLIFPTGEIEEVYLS